MSEDYKEFEIKIPSIEKQKEIVEAIEKDLKNAKTEEEKADIIKKHIETADDSMPSA